VLVAISVASALIHQPETEQQTYADDARPRNSPPVIAARATEPLIHPHPSPATARQMCRHQRFLALAAVEAEQSSETTKHGALLVRGGKVLGVGHNSARSRNTSVPGAANATSLHSEVAAVVAVPWVLQGSSLQL